MYFFCLAWPGLHLIRGLQPWEGKARLCSCSTRCQYDRCRTDMQLTQICVGWNSPISRPLCETHFMIHLQLKCQNRQRNWKNSEILKSGCECPCELQPREVLGMCVHVSLNPDSQLGTVDLQEWVEEAGSPVQLFQVFIITMMIMLLSLPSWDGFRIATYRLMCSSKEL